MLLTIPMTKSARACCFSSLKIIIKFFEEHHESGKAKCTCDDFWAEKFLKIKKKVIFPKNKIKTMDFK